MLIKSKSNIVSDFFLDSAKITFGSLVVGIFAPGVTVKTPFSTFFNGLIATAIFLIIAVKLEKTKPD
jgi:hypothetical protein